MDINLIASTIYIGVPLVVMPIIVLIIHVKDIDLGDRVENWYFWFLCAICLTAWPVVLFAAILSTIPLIIIMAGIFIYKKFSKKYIEKTK